MINLIKFAEQGDADSQFELGVRYANGDGVTQDYAKAAFWFEKAARQGTLLLFVGMKGLANKVILML